MIKGEQERKHVSSAAKLTHNAMAICEATGLEVHMTDPKKARFVFLDKVTDSEDKLILKGIKVLAKNVIQLEAQIMALNKRYPQIKDGPVKAAFIHARNLPPFDQVCQRLRLSWNQKNFHKLFFVSEYQFLCSTIC